MKIILGKKKESTFLVPEGCYSATLLSLTKKDKAKNGKLYHLFTFAFQLDGDPQCQEIGIATKKVWCPYGSDDAFQMCLTDWLGKKMVDQLGSFLDTDELKGLRADVVIAHLQGEGFEDPCVFVQSIHPEGSIRNKQVFKGGLK